MAYLYELLALLRHTGELGFEGFVQKLLEAHTGLRLFRARSGDQDGRDLTTGGDGAVSIAVEVKHYSKAKLDDRDVLGGLAEAVLSPTLDLWILVATISVSDQLQRKLHEMATRQAIEVLILERHHTTEPDAIALLCAAYPDVVLGHLLGAKLDVDAGKLQDDLATVRSHEQYDSLLEVLRKRVASARIGFAPWRDWMHRALVERLSDLHASRAVFGQPLDVMSPRTKAIRRQSVEGAIEGWWSTREKHRSPLALLGEEGDGKTWGAMSWVAGCCATPGPAFVVATSNLVTHSDPVVLLALPCNPKYGWTNTRPPATLVG